MKRQFRRFFYLLFLFWGLCFGTNAQSVVMIGNGIFNEQDKELISAFDFLKQKYPLTSSFLSPAILRKDPAKISSASVLWFHKCDSNSLHLTLKDTAVVHAVQNYIKLGGSLLLTQNAVDYLSLLGIKGVASTKSVKEYHYGKGTILCIASNACFSVKNAEKEHLSLCIDNALKYLSCEVYEMSSKYWEIPDSLHAFPILKSSDTCFTDAYFKDWLENNRSSLWNDKLKYIMDSLLGYFPDAPNQTLNLYPHIPANWDRFQANFVRVGEHTLHLLMERKGNMYIWTFIHKGERPLLMRFKPAFPDGTVIRKFEFYTRSVNPFSRDYDQQSGVNLPIRDTVVCVFTVSGGVALLPDFQLNKKNDQSEIYKVIHTKLDKGIYTIEIEGIPWSKQTLSIYLQDGMPGKVLGAKLIHKKNSVFTYRTTLPNSKSNLSRKTINIPILNK